MRNGEQATTEYGASVIEPSMSLDFLDLILILKRLRLYLIFGLCLGLIVGAGLAVYTSKTVYETQVLVNFSPSSDILAVADGQTVSGRFTRALVSPIVSAAAFAVIKREMPDYAAQLERAGFTAQSWSVAQRGIDARVPLLVQATGNPFVYEVAVRFPVPGISANNGLIIGEMLREIARVANEETQQSLVEHRKQILERADKLAAVNLRSKESDQDSARKLMALKADLAAVEFRLLDRANKNGLRVDQLLRPRAYERQDQYEDELLPNFDDLMRLCGALMSAGKLQQAEFADIQGKLLTIRKSISDELLGFVIQRGVEKANFSDVISSSIPRTALQELNLFILPTFKIIRADANDMTMDVRTRNRWWPIVFASALAGLLSFGMIGTIVLGFQRHMRRAAPGG